MQLVTQLVTQLATQLAPETMMRGLSLNYQFCPNAGWTSNNTL
jgi:hypothetical protein